MGTRFWSWMPNSILGITLACLLLPGLSAATHGGADPSSNARREWGPFEVGLRTIHLELLGSSKEVWPLDVLVWYPADRNEYRGAAASIYTSRLNGVTLDPSLWDPLTWVVAAERARDDVSIDATGPGFPLIAFSPANQGDPFNYAFTMERLASHGYVVAGPFHNGNNQDDRHIDFINALAGREILPCMDGRMWSRAAPCSEPMMARNMTSRALEVAKVIDGIGIYFGDRVDTSRVGIMGQSRGTMTALAQAGGSALWRITPDPRVKAVMTLATGSAPNMASVDMEHITVPTLMVTGTKDGMNHFQIAVDAFARIPETTPKGLVIIEGAHHRVYGDAYCAQAQAAAAIRRDNLRAILDESTLFNLFFASPNSGSPFDWCPYDTFVNPVDVTDFLEAYTGVSLTPESVPTSLESAEVMRLTTELAVTFFKTVLDNRGQDGMHFTRYLSPRFLLHHESDIYSADFFASAGDICPEGQDVECGD